MSRKQLHSLVALVACFCFTSFTYAVEVTPANTVFCFDFNVLVSPDVINSRLEYTRLVTKYPRLATLLVRPQFWKDLENIRKGMSYNYNNSPQSNPIGDFDGFQKKYHWAFYGESAHAENLRQDIFKILAHYKLNEDIIFLLKQLKKRGFKLYLVANVEEEFLRNYIIAFIHKEYRVDFNQLFDDYCCGDKEPDFYINIAERVHADGKEQIMLVETEARSINLAYQTQEGYLAHVYTTLESLIEDNIIQQALSYRKLKK